MTLAAASGDHSRSLFAIPAIVADRRADGSILVKSTTPLQPGARCIGDWLEHWARQAPERVFSPIVPAPMRRGRRSPTRTRCSRSARRGVDPRARAERRASAGDPVRQQRRARAVRARGPACRRAIGRDLAGLFADVQRFRQAQEHGQTARARRDLCFRHEAVRGGAGGDQAAAFGRHHQRLLRTIVTRSLSAPSRPRRKRLKSKRHLPRSRPTRSPNSCSRQARPARQRPSSIPSAC